MPVFLRVSFVCAAALALLVVTLGAYVRLKDAGLGCPDWPGCYGQLVGVPSEDSSGAAIDSSKAWIEVTHRYVAAVLGLLVLACTAMAFAWRTHRTVATVLLLLVVVQAGLGALTVTELLKPAIVTSHLLGGMMILALLAAVALSGDGVSPRQSLGSRTRALIVAAILALVVQVALGGWVSSNYAGLACGTSFPTCSGSWLPAFDASALALDRELGKDADGAPITQASLAFVQWAHRVGAAVLTLIVAALSVSLWSQGRRLQGLVLCALLLTQLGLGIRIVTNLLPLPESLSHNVVAALLCVALAQVALTCDSIGERA